MQSIEHQRTSIMAWIEAKGYKNQPIIEFADQGISGAKSSDIRLGFGELLKEINAKKISKCILFEISRASRDFMEFLKFLDLCSKHGCEVEVAGCGIQSFTTSTDMLMAAVQGFLAQSEREKISQRVKSGIANKKLQGKKFGAKKGEQRNKGFRKIYPQDLVDAIRKYTNMNLSVRQIAEIVGIRFTAKPISYVTVSNIQKRYGIFKPNKQESETVALG
jgi:DNA invertase Pin-like site-specific DNA recombinase